MAKHAHISRYYADDKDIADLLSQSGIKPYQLAAFLRERGIVVSANLSKEELIQYFRFVSFAWPDFDVLVARLDRPDREEDFTGCRIKAPGVEIAAVLERLAAIKGDRGQRFAEIHKSEVLSVGVIELKVQYTEIDPSKTRALQRRDRALTIRIEKTGNILKVRYHDNAQAKAIVARLHVEIASVAKGPVNSEVIDVSGLSSAQRDDFFVRMARNIDGFELDGVNDMKFERPDSSVPTTQAERDDIPVSAQFRGVVEKAVLTGSDLLLSEEYQRYSSKGYAIRKMVWVITEAARRSDVVELMAEFRGQSSNEFRYDVTGAYRRMEDGSLSEIRAPVRGAEKQRYLELLEASAYSTLDLVRPNKSNA